MTRKHMEAIAAILAAVANTEARQELADAFAEWLATENPRFDARRFLTACRVEPS